MSLFILYSICYFAVPLWMLAGICDWHCHRATHIEATSGTKESLLHSLMLVEMGVPILAALFLEINALILLLMLAMWCAHEATALWDVSYAHKHRYLSPFEQHVHSFLELMPLLVLILISALHWPQFAALFGMGNAAADFSLRWKEAPLPAWYLTTVMSAVVLLQVIPYAEELWRCRRVAKSKEGIETPIDSAHESIGSHGRR